MTDELIAATDIEANLDERKPVSGGAAEPKLVGISLRGGELLFQVFVGGRVTHLSYGADGKLRNEHGKEMPDEANAVAAKGMALITEAGAFLVANLFAGVK